MIPLILSSNFYFKLNKMITSHEDVNIKIKPMCLCTISHCVHSTLHFIACMNQTHPLYVAPSAFTGWSRGQLGSLCASARRPAGPPGGAVLAAEARRMELHHLLRPEGGEQIPGGAAGADCGSQHGPHGGPPHTHTHSHAQFIKSAQCDCDIPLCAFAVDGVVPAGPPRRGRGRQARDKLS